MRLMLKSRGTGRSAGLTRVAFTTATRVIQAFVDNLEAWERHSLDTQRFIGAGDRVVVFWQEVGRGKGSGVEVESDTTVIYTVAASGKVVHAQGYTDRAEALAAVGLRE